MSRAILHPLILFTLCSQKVFHFHTASQVLRKIAPGRQAEAENPLHSQTWERAGHYRKAYNFLLQLLILFQHIRS